jgi:hypothetical protein
VKPWQFNVLFGIAAAGSVFLLFAKNLGIELDPTALTGFGAILTYVLTQHWTGGGNGKNGNGKKDEEKKPSHKKGSSGDDDE